jgi:hypothetical protein
MSLTQVLNLFNDKWQETDTEGSGWCLSILSFSSFVPESLENSSTRQSQ